MKLLTAAVAFALLASAASAGYLDRQARKSPVHGAVKDVAAQGCEVEIRTWWDLHVKHGGNPEDANWDLSQLLVAKEMERTSKGPQTFRLKGVAGC
jgi:hypothetical protein